MCPLEARENARKTGPSHPDIDRIVGVLTEFARGQDGPAVPPRRYGAERRRRNNSVKWRSLHPSRRTGSLRSITPSGTSSCTDVVVTFPSVGTRAVSVSVAPSFDPAVLEGDEHLHRAVTHTKKIYGSPPGSGTAPTRWTPRGQRTLTAVFTLNCLEDSRANLNSLP